MTDNLKPYNKTEFKISVITYKVLTSTEPSYLADIVRPPVLSCYLCSSDRHLLHKERTNLGMTNHAVCTYGLEQFAFKCYF